MSGFDNEEYMDSVAPVQVEDPRLSEFEKDIRRAINRHCMENESGTPDFILATYLAAQLQLFNQTVQYRAGWRGESVELPALQKLQEGKRVVPLVIYAGNLRMRNDIGEAEIKLTPGEQIPLGLVGHVVAVLEDEEVHILGEESDVSDEN